MKVLYEFTVVISPSSVDSKNPFEKYTFNFFLGVSASDFLLIVPVSYIVFSCPVVNLKLVLTSKLGVVKVTICAFTLDSADIIVSPSKNLLSFL